MRNPLRVTDWEKSTGDKDISDIKWQIGWFLCWLKQAQWVVFCNYPPVASQARPSRSWGRPGPHWSPSSWQPSSSSSPSSFSLESSCTWASLLPPCGSLPDPEQAPRGFLRAEREDLADDPLHLPPSTLLYYISLLPGCWNIVQNGDPLYAGVNHKWDSGGHIWPNWMPFFAK